MGHSQNAGTLKILCKIKSPLRLHKIHKIKINFMVGHKSHSQDITLKINKYCKNMKEKQNRAVISVG